MAFILYFVLLISPLLPAPQSILKPCVPYKLLSPIKLTKTEKFPRQLSWKED